MNLARKVMGLGLISISPYSIAATETMIIEGKVQEPPEFLVIEEDLSAVPGGTNLIDTEELAGSQSSLAKVLSQQSGIVVQEFFGGNDQPRINIRGSGIQDNPVNRGIQLLFDGLPLNQADGSFVIGLVDPEQARLLSVYRGANAMRYGATTLGGAINFHGKNGLNTANEVHAEVGSYGLMKGGFALANSDQQWDYYLSASSSHREGYRNHSEASRDSLTINVGYTSLNWHNRTYINLAENDFEIPFLLTKQRAIDTPEQVMGEGDEPMDTLLNIPVRKPFRQTSQFRIANRSQWFNDDSEHQLGVYFEHLDDEFRNPLTQADTQHKNIGMDASFTFHSYSNDYLERQLLLFLQGNSGEMPREIASVHPATGKLMKPMAKMGLTAKNVTLGAQGTYEWLDGLSSIVALQWVYNRREINDELTEELLDSSFEYQIVNPKLGLVYQLSDENRLYANLSGSSEAPNFWQLATVSANPTDPLNNHVFINQLNAQTATTSEVGGDFHFGDFSAKASWYYSWVKDELISVVGDFAVNGQTVNYQGETIHHGVELSINHESRELWLVGDQMTSTLIYNWSDFYFEDGLYQGNQIAGVPVHLIQGNVDYLFMDSWRLSPNFTWQPQETFTDHMNTSQNSQDPYLLLGLKLGYQPNHQFQIFAEINNLTNTTYQTAYAIRGQGAADLPTFIPGPGINGIIGARYTW